MRSLEKGKKPAILIEKEADWTHELLSYVNAGQKVPENIKGRYRHLEIKEALLTETSHKCAYCESKITHIDHGDIEHIDPKSIFPNKTYLWENLTIGCGKCNLNKSNYYDQSYPLLNPYVDKPEDKIVFIGPVPIPRDGDDRADVTIKQLKLDRLELVERRIEHIKMLKPLIREYQKSTNDNLRRLVLQDLLERVQPDKEFTLMTKQILDELAITG